ncbi:MAG: GtrA family protein [bacterium]|nr:GtrA family protein [bacterium]
MFSYLWSLRHQFIKYFIVGISGVVLDMGSLILFKEWFGIAPTVAIVINQVFLLSYNFSLNKYWSFREHPLSHRQVTRYLTLAFANYIFSVVVMYVFNHLLNFEYRLVRIATIAIAVAWNFFLYKYWVYTKVEDQQNGQS